VVWNAAMGVDLNASVFVKTLMAMRFLPARLAGAKGTVGKGFALTFDGLAGSALLTMSNILCISIT